MSLQPQQVFLLSKQEKACIQHLALGASKKEIAYIMNLSPHTVRHYLEYAYDKLHARSAAHAAILSFIDYPELALDIIKCVKNSR